jgi:hypothetical protein
VLQPIASGVKVAIGRVKRYISSGNDRIPTELIQASGETLRSEIRKLNKLVWKEE